MYIVEVRNGRGALLYNVTVTVPQLDIAIPDPCDQYQATVTAVCGTTSGSNNISLKFFVGKLINIYVLHCTDVASLAITSIASVCIRVM